MQEANATLRPKQQVGQILTHEVKEIGQHILVCAVTYKSNAGEKLFFRKFFKFPVNKPIDVRTKFYNVEDNMVSSSHLYSYITNVFKNSDVYLEAQIQNLCINSLVLERVILEPSVEHYSDEKDPVIIQPQEVYQYLFCLSPVTKEEATGVNNFRGASAISVIGKLDMYWRTSMGERGRLQTSPLQRMAPGYGDLRLTVENIPKRVKLQQLFTITCRLYNCCERSLDLMLTLDGSLQPALIFCSVSGVHLGQILPNNSIEFTLEILPTAKGLYAISGLRLTDSLLRRTYEHDEIAQVIVCRDDSREIVEIPLFVFVKYRSSCGVSFRKLPAYQLIAAQFCVLFSRLNVFFRIHVFILAEWAEKGRKEEIIEKLVEYSSGSSGPLF
ncbi:putative trafficking protein particle complex subunit 13 like protein [Ditylenchus destructor]|nr:putative trafficking protein particle complex subunit 13 like protein [Ditylenchus destructor]